jgi:hypothetical protein
MTVGGCPSELTDVTPFSPAQFCVVVESSLTLNPNHLAVEDKRRVSWYAPQPINEHLKVLVLRGLGEVEEEGRGQGE